MTVHAVYVPEHLAPDPAVAVETAEIVRERFSIPAFLFGPLWLLRHRAWPEFVAFAVLSLAAGAALRFYPTLIAQAGELYLLACVFLGLAAPDIRGRALERRGFRLREVVIARRADEALRRFGEHAAFASVPVPAPVVEPAVRAVPVLESETGVIGLFPEARR